MAYLDETVPAETDAVKRGASRIRDLKIALNTLIAKIFADTGEFLSKWITTAQIADKAVGTGQLADTAVTAAKIASNAVTTTKILDGAVTAAKLAGDVQQTAVGTYAGAYSTTSVSGLTFTPDVVLIVANGRIGAGIGFRSEAGPLHPCWGDYSVYGLTALPSAYLAALSWTTDGFAIVGGNWTFNQPGVTYFYLALKVS